jgi:hypothetical protein
MILQLENSLSRASEVTSQRLDAVISGAREGTDRVAGRVLERKKSVHQLSQFGIKLSRVGQKTADKLLKQQEKMIDRQLDGIARRLKAAAAAKDLPGLIRSQLPLLPEGPQGIVTETRATVGIFIDAGGEVRGLVRDTVAELKGETRPAKKKAARKKAPARKAAPKTAAKKPARRKAAPVRTKKATARKAVAGKPTTELVVEKQTETKV